MNKMKCILLGMSLTVLATSCRKYDFMDSGETVTPVSEWTTVSQWSSSADEGKNIFTSSIKDSSITADVVQNGLVLTYLKSAATVESLPFQQTGSTSAYWYHQVSENSIEFNAEVTGSGKMGASQLRYFVITPSRLKALEEGGHPAADLMALTYEQATALLK